MKNKLLLAIFGLGIGLRLAQIWTPPLWYDENFSWILARLPFQQMWAANLGDVHPPLWYLVIWPLGQIAHAPGWIIRLPAALFSIAGLVLFWLILRKMTSIRTIQLAALIFLAIGPIQIYYAHEGRMYALMQFCILAAWLSILNRKWVWLTLSLIALIYTQNVGVIYAVCLAAAGFIYDRKQIKPLLVCFGLAGLAWLCWVPSLLHQMSIIEGRYWIAPVTLGAALYNYAQLAWIANQALRLEIASVVVLYSWIFYAMWYMFRNHRQSYLIWCLSIMAFGPFLIEILISVLWQPILLYRTLLGVTPFLYFILAIPVVRFVQSRHLAWVCLTIVLPLQITWYILYGIGINNPSLYGEDLILLTDIEQSWQPGDIVYAMSDSTVVDHWPYLDRTSGHLYKNPECAPIIGSLSDETRAAIGFPIQSLSTLVFDRAWIISAATPFNPLCETDYINQYISGITPVRCLGDDMISSCLYLLEVMK